MFFSGLPPLPGCSSGQWSEFFNRDNPLGNGDFETLQDINYEYPGRACSNPIAVDAREASNQRDYQTSGQVVEINPIVGFICENRQQPPGQTCLNYQVRFCCPSM